MSKGTSLDDPSLSAEVELRKAERDEERAKYKVQIAEKKVTQRTEQVRIATANSNAANDAVRRALDARNATDDERKQREAEERAAVIDPLKIEADKFKELLKISGQELKRKRKEQRTQKKADSSRKSAFEKAEKRKIQEANRMKQKAKKEGRNARKEAEKKHETEKKRIYDEFIEQKKFDTKICVAEAKEAAAEASYNRENPARAYKDKYDERMDELEDIREQDETDQLEDVEEEYKQKLEEIAEEVEVCNARADQLKEEAAYEVAEAREQYQNDIEDKAEEYKELGEEIDRLEAEYKENKQEAQILFKELNALVKIDKAAKREHNKDTAELRKFENKAKRCARIERGARQDCEAAHKYADKMAREAEYARDQVEIKRKGYQATSTTNPLTPVRSKRQ
jgi:fused signal recognition particle receptor